MRRLQWMGHVIRIKYEMLNKKAMRGTQKGEDQLEGPEGVG